MNILCVTENLGSGGAERQLTRLAVALHDSGHSVAVVTWRDLNFHAGYLAEHHVEHIQFPPCSKPSRVWRLNKLIRHRHTDVVISFLPSPNETAALATIGTGARLIVGERSFTINWGWRRRITNLLYRRTDYIVANSNNEAENIRRHCPALASRVRAIPNFVELDSFHPLTGRPSNPVPRLIGVGRVIPTKNIHRLIEALAVLHNEGLDFNLEWYGAQWDQEYCERLTTLAAERGIASRVHLCGECDHIAAVYPLADIFVMPSLLEGYPNVLVEAMASELPVVASAVHEHPYIVDEGVGGFLFNPNDVDDLCRALREALALTPEQRHTMGEHNRAMCLQRNSPEAFLNAYLSLINN